MDEECKTCIKCRVEKPIAAFHRCAARIGGYNGLCTECLWTQRAENRALKAAGKLLPALAARQRQAERLAEGKRHCTKCGQTKGLAEFGSDKACADGRAHCCKTCSTARSRAWHTHNPERARVGQQRYYQQTKGRLEYRGYARAYREKHREKIRERSRAHYEKVKNTSEYKELRRTYQEKRREAARAYREKYPEKVRERARTHYAKHRERLLEVGKTYREQHRPQRREYWREYKKQRAATDFDFRLHHILRTQIQASAINSGGKKSARTEEILGCPVPEFRQYLEANFLPGMTWENYGAIWEIGHVKPCAMFDLSDPAQQRECYNYTNLKPQSVEDNRSAGARYEGVDFRGGKAAEFSAISVPLAGVRELIECYHYAHSAPSAATRCYALVKKDLPAEFLGAAIFRPAPLGTAKQQHPEDPQKVLCLSRLVVVPNMPANTTGCFLAGCLRLLSAEQKWVRVITYADTWQGHDGGIYRATNWKSLGETAPQPVWTLNGQFVGKRRGKQHPLTNAELHASGAIFHGKFPKHVYTRNL